MAYAEYKDSGVQWIGEIPKWWGICRLKQLLKKNKGAIKTGPFGSQLKSSDMTDQGVKVYNQRTVLDGDFQQGTSYVSHTKFNELKAFEVFPGDILITSRGTIGRCVIVPEGIERGLLHPCLIRIQLESQLITNRYARMIIQESQFFRENLIFESNATTIDVIYSETLREVVLPLPPYEEQLAILAYLDRKTAQIDRLIDIKRRQIALLQEERTAIINQAVTRGLNPNAPWKDSGIEWIGEIPEGWDLYQLGRIGRFSKGNGGTKEDEVNEGVPCVRYGDLYTQHEYHIRASRSCVTPERSVDYTAIHYGDILFAGSGETLEEIGKSAVNLIQSEVCCGGDVIIFRPTIEVNPEFMGYVSDCPRSTYQKACMGRGITVMHIYANQLKYMYIALPSESEQSRIVEYLSETTSNIDRTITRTQDQIELLQEYRTTLISDAVTGKIDVREEAAA